MKIILIALIIIIMIINSLVVFYSVKINSYKSEIEKLNKIIHKTDSLNKQLEIELKTQEKLYNTIKDKYLRFIKEKEVSIKFDTTNIDTIAEELEKRLR